MNLLHFLVTLATLTSLLACTPALDWREVRFEGGMEAGNAGPLTALLPCKPDRATRDQVVGGEKVSLSMMGCQASGATFTLSRMVLKTPASAPHVLAAWQAATLANLVPGDKTSPAMPASASFKVQGASIWPAPLHVRVVAGEVAWFAQSAGSETVLYQAAIYGSNDAKPLAADATGLFFESLRLP